jgi:alpha-tubulin suppressor-like RCC1 family protein
MQLHRAILPLTALAILAACSDDSTSPDQTPASISLTLDTLDFGDTTALDFIVTNENGDRMTNFPVQDLVLTSSDSSIARIDQQSMTVTGVGLGDATITARYGSLEASDTLPVRLGYAPPQRITAGRDHTCILDGDGAAWCWGGGTYGRLGNGEEKDSPVPVAVAGGHSFETIVAGYYHTCAVDDGRSTWCWGDGSTGELGSDTTRSAVPIEISGMVKDFVQLAAGDGFTCGLVYGGIVFCWGYSQDGELGRGDRDYYTSVPDLVKMTARFVRIAASGLHSCGLTRLGKAYCWGEGYYGALGTGDQQDQLVPTAVADTLTFVNITGGYWHTCGVDRTGQTFCWGYDEHGEMGIGTVSTVEMSPVRVHTSESFSFVSQGRAGHLCGIGAVDSIVYCWGYNSNGQAGDGSTTDVLTPRPVGSLAARAVATGFSHTCALSPQNRVFCWGMNLYGQAGNGTSGGDVLAPVEVVGR